MKEIFRVAALKKENGIYEQFCKWWCDREGACEEKIDDDLHQCF